MYTTSTPIHHPHIQAKAWRNIDIPGDFNSESCWNWTGNTSTPFGPSKVGHGVFTSKRKGYQAHRVIMELTIGRLLGPDEVVRHKCDNPLCCNPNHLETGTQADNVRDRVMRKRSATGRRNGAYTHPENRPRGSKHRGAQIKEKTAALIKGALQHESLHDKYGALPAIANHFDVSYGVVQGIKNNGLWAHVTPKTPDVLPLIKDRGSVLVKPSKGRKKALTEETVKALRMGYHEQDKTPRQLSEEFGVSKVTILNVLKHKTWDHVSSPYPPVGNLGHGNTDLSYEDIQEIRATYRIHERPGLKAALARRFKTTPTTIHRILSGVVWTHVEEDDSKAIDPSSLS